MKHAFIDSDGVLVSWGYAVSNNNDKRVNVPEDFELEPGKWRRVGTKWVAVEPAAPADTAE